MANAEHITKERAKRIANREKGNCSCGNPPRTGFTNCTKCRERDYAYRQRYKQDRAERNVCAKCGDRPRRDGRTTCQPCGSQSVAKTLARHRERKALGLCPQCASPAPVEPGFVLCPLCRAAFRHMNNKKFFAGLRNEILERDGHRCRLCDEAKGLVVHHIDGSRDNAPTLNNRPDNLITLCVKCHRNLEGLLFYVKHTSLLHDLLRRRPLKRFGQMPLRLAG